MATIFYLRNSPNSGDGNPGVHRGTNTAKLNAAASGWSCFLLATSRGTIGGSQFSASTVAGATNGVEVMSGEGFPIEWISLPLAAAVTISGTITLNLWGSESSMSANVAINAIIDRLQPNGTITQIAKSARVIETGTSSAAENFTVAPTSTALVKGDRIRVRVFGDDAGTMAAAFSFACTCGGTTAGATGESYVSFTETITVQTTQPTGTILYLTNTAGPAVGAQTEKEMWTSRGSSVQFCITNTVTGWTAPVQHTISSVVAEWYSKPLQAFTLDGLIRFNLWCSVNAGSLHCSIRVEIAVCNGDGSSPVIWTEGSLVDSASPGGVHGLNQFYTGAIETQDVIRGWLSAPSVSVTNGQRLRFRAFADDASDQPMVAGGNVQYLAFNVGTASINGDTWIQLPQSVSEYSAGGTPTPKLGDTTVSAMKLGDTAVSKVYLGDIQVL